MIKKYLETSLFTIFELTEIQLSILQPYKTPYIGNAVHKFNYPVDIWCENMSDIFKPTNKTNSYYCYNKNFKILQEFLSKQEHNIKFNESVKEIVNGD